MLMSHVQRIVQNPQRDAVRCATLNRKNREGTIMTEKTYLSEAPAAAVSGSLASERFAERIASAETHGVVDTERVDLLAGRAIKALNDIILEERVSYDEYNALKAWLIKVGNDGEWPLFLDVWPEQPVEDVATDHRDGNSGSLARSYYV